MEFNFKHEPGLYEVLASRRNAEDLAREVHENEGPSSCPTIDVLLLDVRKNRKIVAKISWELDGRDIDIESGSKDVTDEEMIDLLVTDGHDALMLAMDRCQALSDANNRYHGQASDQISNALRSF